MTNANTADNATLKIGPETAKPLWYNDERASSSNTWEEGEVISVYYDGANYKASNAMGGGSAVGKKKLTLIPGYIENNGDTLGSIHTASADRTNYRYIKYPAKEGDVVQISGTGASGARLWGIVGEEDVMLDAAAANLSASDLVLVMPEGTTFITINSRTTSNPEWYYAKAGSVGAHEMLTEAYLLNDVRTLVVGDHYKKGEAVKTTDKQLLVLTDNIEPISLTEEISEGLLRFRSNSTYLSKTSIKNYSDTPTVPYTNGDYAIGSPAGAVIQVTVDGTAIAALEEATDITVTIAGIELTVTVDSTMDAAGVAAAIYTAFGTQDEWKLTDNEDGTLTLISKVAKNAASTISTTTGDTGITVQFVEDSVYAGSLKVSIFNNDVWTEVTVSDYVASTDIWEQKDASWIAENKCKQNSIKNILEVPRKVEFEHTGGGKSSSFIVYNFFPVEKNKKYTVTLKTLSSFELGSSRLTLKFSNSNEVEFTNVDLATERSFILTPTSYSANTHMQIWSDVNTRNVRFHITISWIDYIDNIDSGFELLMEEYNKRNAKYVTEEKIVKGLSSPRKVYISAIPTNSNFGNVVSNSSLNDDYRVTDYIPCKGVAKINASLYLANNGWGYGLAFYDENKIPIKTREEYWNYANTDSYNRWLINVPKNACYFRNSQWKQDAFPFTFYYDTSSPESLQNSLKSVQENINTIKDEVFDIPESTPVTNRRSYYGDKLTFKEHKFTSEQYMSLSLSGIGQGAANYGKYYIVGNTNGAKFDVFDLETKTKLGVITVPAPSIGNTHSNTIAFSNKFYEAGDEFPIMYNCSGYGTGNNPTTFAVYGYRIINNNGEFTATLVHTITLTGTGGWTEFVIDNENNTAWIKLESSTLGYVWYKVPMPALSNGDITIDLDSLTPEFKVPSYLGSAQGHLFYKGKIYYTADSLTDSNIHRLYVLDVSIGRFSAIINTAYVYNSETENVFVYDEHLFIGYRGRVYKLYFD